MMNKQDMRDLNNLFNSVKDMDEKEFSGFKKIVDGAYNALIDDLEVKDSKSGKPMFVVTYKILDGEFKGYNHKQFIMLCGNDETQVSRNLNRFATTIKKLGIDTTQGLEYAINNLGRGLNKQVIVKVETTVAKNGNEYTNTSFELK